MNNDLKSVPVTARIFSYSRDLPRSYSNFTDRAPFFADLSVNGSDTAPDLGYGQNVDF